MSLGGHPLRPPSKGRSPFEHPMIARASAGARQRPGRVSPSPPGPLSRSEWGKKRDEFRGAPPETPVRGAWPLDPHSYAPMLSVSNLLNELRHKTG